MKIIDQIWQEVADMHLAGAVFPNTIEMSLEDFKTLSNEYEELFDRELGNRKATVREIEDYLTLTIKIKNGIKFKITEST